MKTPKQFYKKIKAEGLSKLKSSKRHNKELEHILQIINKKQNILDLGCGYGRITAPLAKKGYKIEGIDLVPTLIKEARKNAKEQKIKIIFKIGDMRELPYKNDSFDVILCLWSAFNELTIKSDQIRTIKDMLRILKKGGFVFIDLPSHLNKKIAKKQGLTGRYVLKKNLSVTNFNGIESMPQYLHTSKTLINLMKICKIREYKIKISKFGGRKRLILQFWKF